MPAPAGGYDEERGMSLWDLVEPKIHGMSLPRAMRLLQSGQIPHPDMGDGLGSVMTRPDELPPPPPKKSETDKYIDRLTAETKAQAAIDEYEMRVRLIAKGVPHG